MPRGFRRKGGREEAELNITTFMNLMVVLVPFLLLSAVFSEITIHELNLPTLAENSSAAADDRQKLVLEVVVRRDSLDVIDRNGGRLKLIPNLPSGHDFAALHEKLRQVKSSFLSVTSVTLLLEPDVHYNTLVSTMDAVRTYDQQEGGKTVKVDLFPDVSIGDAPIIRAGGDQ